MKKKISREDILIREELRPGDIGYLTYLHGCSYQREYGYGIAFEAYVARGMGEFYQHYDPGKDGVWICGYQDKIVGSLFLVHREEAAQLRYFLLLPPFRGIGLGNELMNLYMHFLKSHSYTSSYLWTTDELHAAAGLYLKHGFKLTEEKESAAFGKKLQEQRYELIL